jgi:quinol monooxygenase YgiN
MFVAKFPLPTFRVLIIAIGMSLIIAETAFPRTLYVVVHVDFPSKNTPEGAKLLQQFAEECTQDPGFVRFDLLQDNGPSNHFTLIEVWKDSKAFAAHESADHTKRFREKLQPLLGSPFDERLDHVVR